MAIENKDKLVTVEGLKLAYDALNTSLGSKMDKGTYDPQNKRQDVFKYTEDTVNTAVSNIQTQKIGPLTSSVSAIQTEINNAHTVKDGSETYNYENLKDALSGVIGIAKTYTDTALEKNEAFKIKIVNSIDFSTAGEPFTFYLIPNDSNNGYKKYWYVNNKWDSFGSSATKVVNTLPTTGEEDTDYIYNTGSGYVYYKWINNKWEIIAGSMAVVLETLPETGNSLTDYYIGTESFIHYRWINNKFVVVGGDSYSKTEVDNKIANIMTTNVGLQQLRTDVSNNTSSIISANSAIGNLQTQINNIDIEGKTYSATLTQDGDKYIYSLIETDKDETTVVSSFPLPATGGGGGGSNTNLIVDKITPSPYIVTTSVKPVIEINYSSTDTDGSPVDGTYVLKTGNITVSSGLLVQGKNSFDISEYCSVGTQTFTLTVTDDGGSVSVKTWKVQVVDVSISSTFNDRYSNAIGRDVSFTYTITGAVSKAVHFKLDGEEIDEITVNGTGLQSYTIPSQAHGSHLLEVWATATISGIPIETEHIFKDIIWYDASQVYPVIGCIYRNDYYGQVHIRQYDTKSITLNVFDPKTASPNMVIYEDGTIINQGTLDISTNNQTTYNYTSSNIGEHTVEILIGTINFNTNGLINNATSRYSTLTIVFVVDELGIDVSPVTANLEIDFNPTGITNSSANRLWTNGKYRMTVSDNFDWSNGGYKTDENNESYFLIKAGTRATFNYEMFTGNLLLNTSDTGSEMKIIFKTENVQSPDAIWLSNVETRTVNGKITNTGIQLSVHEGWLKTNNASDTAITVGEGEDEETIAATNTYLYVPYCEEEVIELDINIEKINREDEVPQSFIMAYEDGVPSKAYGYDTSDNLYQYSPKPIVIGSDKCDVKIYRLKIYSSSLSTENIMKNFIADARNSTEMLSRYDRNCIYYNRDTNEYTPYSGDGVLTPERLAQRIPNVKVLMLETDHFTTSKKTFVKSTLRCIHASGGLLYPGDEYYDNWFFENGHHAGQGTTSDNYGTSARNVDFLFNCDGTHKPSDKVNAEANYISKVTLGYNTENATTESVTDWKGDKGKVTLTRTSVPNNFFNFKANVASSENVNNALLQKRYNDFLPYISPAKKRDPKIKNDMEFVPAVLFLKETNPDISKHNEFMDTEWHFYCLGNLGDSKKTDYTRAYDPEDMNEFTIEISDNTKNNSTFQTGVFLDSNGNRKIETYTKDSNGNAHSVENPKEYVYPITEQEWENVNNMRRWTLHNEAFDGDHSFEPRYACCGDYRDGKLVNDTTGRGEAQVAKDEDVFRAFYKWVVTSTDEEFIRDLDQWCVRSAVEFFYAFTHYYTMMDNRSKNTFWHFAKTGTFRQVTRPVKELLHVYCEKSGNNYTPTTDTIIVSGKTYYTQYAFDLWDYDNDKKQCRCKT